MGVIPVHFWEKKGKNGVDINEKSGRNCFLPHIEMGYNQ